MSRRLPTSGIQRPGSRAPSITRLSRAPSSNSVARHAAEAASPAPRRRRLSNVAAAAGSVRMPTQSAETNINVVVRCRGRSEPELAEGSPAIVACGGPLSKALTVETSPLAAASSAASSAFTTASGYAGGGQPNTRTYGFDKVFGPEADQNMIFNEVADKMLDEVLAGYNCTIFAYGQTGTGKTYTMQGDTVPTALVRPAHDAGIIPRVLHKLFSDLESRENAEYAVKCSYIELYNEELRDLLAPEYKDSVGSAIKIFEDASKKGVHVQGVEEAGLRDLKDGLAALEKGTRRRQTAETKLNSESSRSHSIFTLTIHVRESGVDKGDEDLLRIGKFNLVDLAGSEAIGRSGAENKRAREAGMINQSLLTLGRVISALVDKGSHIPYRESKLTRLLQDSLGGRTKTCIIATVSPTRSNMEETISTLDYALRAKSIKNKPELNAHLTKAGLLKEYVADIERLKAELFATREKNGIYIPEDMYTEMQKNQTRQKTDFDDARQRVSAIEVELKSRKTEFEILSERFVTTTDELAVVRESERQLTDMVEQAKVDVETLRSELGEERVVAEAFQAGEERLHSVASELQGVAAESVRDVGGLFAKLGRLTDVLDTNTDGATRFGSEMQALSADLKEGIEELYSVQAGFGDVIREDLEAYAQRGEQESTAHLRELDTTFNSFNGLVKTLSSSIDEGKLGGSDATTQILAIKDEVQASVRSWSQDISARSTQMTEYLLDHQEEHLNVVGKVLDSTTQLLDAVITAARENIASQATTFATSQALVTKATDAEITRLRAQNDLLTRLLTEEQTKSATLRTDLINNITSMIVGFTDSQDASLRAAVGKVNAGNDSGIEKVGAFASQHAAVIEQGSRLAASFSTNLESWSADVEGHRGQGDEALEMVATGMSTQLGTYAEQTTVDAEKHVGTVDAFCGRLGGAASKLATDSAQRAQSQANTLSSISQNVSDGHERASKRLKRNAGEVAHLTSTLLTSHATSAETSADVHDAAQHRLSEIESSTARFLTGIAIDEPTGATPRKRTYEMPTWQRTQPRHMLIHSFRRTRTRNGNPSPDPAPRLSAALASTLSESTVYSPSDEYISDKPLPRVSSGMSLSSLKSSTGSQDSMASSTNKSGSIFNTISLPPPAPTRQLSASSLGPSARLASPKRLVRKLSREEPLERKHSRDERVERKHSRDGERIERPVFNSVLGEGGNVPRPRRR